MCAHHLGKGPYRTHTYFIYIFSPRRGVCSFLLEKGFAAIYSLRELFFKKSFIVKAFICAYKLVPANANLSCFIGISWMCLNKKCNCHPFFRKKKSEGTYDIPYWDRAGNTTILDSLTLIY